MLIAVPPERFSIVQVTPYPWDRRNEVNAFVEHVSAELAERGHRVAIATPSRSQRGVREARRLIDGARQNPEVLFGSAWRGERALGDGPPVLPIGPALPLPAGATARVPPMPLDGSRSLEALVAGTGPDIVHVHDPFAPSASSVALRHSHALNVGSFHEPTERILSTQLARPLVEIFFGRLDARTVGSRQVEELMQRFFPGAYERIEAGAGSGDGTPWPGDSADGERLRIAFCGREERGALRLFLRALRRIEDDPRWEAAIWLEDRTEPRISKRLRERVRMLGPREIERGELIAAADLVCLASGGTQTDPGAIRAALASGTIPVVSQLPIYQELTADGESGLLFPNGDAITLAGQLERLIGEPALRDRLHAAATTGARSWSDAATEIEEIYARICARRHGPGNVSIQGRLARRPQINVDLHMHTDHSSDCATPVRTLLETARDRGLGAIAVTDHNEISGALAAREIAAEIGIKVIVGEEIKTAEQGEVIGLFIEEKIPRGLTMAETIADIRRQGGLVYVPHPFDRLHSVPDYEHLLDIVEDIDILEVFNPRVALSAFNEEAERFATKYRIVPGAGSDSHVAQGLGSVMTRLHDFDGPEEFLESMRIADIVHKHRNLVYVQALKFIQTSGGRGGRRAEAPAPSQRIGKR